MIPLLLETIRLLDGKLLHLHYHQDRVDRTLLQITGQVGQVNLADTLIVPDENRLGCYKVRVLYRKQIEAIELVPYSIRPVRALQMVHIDDTFHYDHKYADREKLQALFAARTFGDDILLVRNGLLTDTSYANVALFDGSDWYTPLQPLLMGTARARLLQEGQIKEAGIHRDDLSSFQKIRLINAMMDWEEGPVISVVQLR